MSLDVTNTLPTHPTVPGEIGRHIHQIVREALTNTRKHAPGQPVRLSLTGHAGEVLLIEVVNPVPGAVPVSVAIPGAGLGLVGLRERVELAGGTLAVSIDDTDQHRLRVRLPWPT